VHAASQLDQPDQPANKEPVLTHCNAENCETERVSRDDDDDEAAIGDEKRDNCCIDDDDDDDDALFDGAPNFRFKSWQGWHLTGNTC
jgi:hypothetical protein